MPSLDLTKYPEKEKKIVALEENQHWFEETSAYRWAVCSFELDSFPSCTILFVRAEMLKTETDEYQEKAAKKSSC